MVNRAYAYFDGNTDTCYSTNLQPLLSSTTDSVSTIVGGVGDTVCTPGDLQVCFFVLPARRLSSRSNGGLQEQ